MQIISVRRGEPLAYVIGHQPFLDCSIDLSQRPLIPRPETEQWSQQCLRAIEDASAAARTPHPLRVLDAFCGSGCVGVAVLKHFAGRAVRLQVDFADIEPRYLTQVAINLRRNGVAASPHVGSLLCSDVLSAVTDSRYDFILANPPYIDPARTQVSESVLRHEPHTALFAADRGLYFVQRLLCDAAPVLRAGAQVWVEFDPWQKPLLESGPRRTR